MNGGSCLGGHVPTVFIQFMTSLTLKLSCESDYGVLKTGMANKHNLGLEV